MTFAFLPVAVDVEFEAVDVEFETAAIVEFEALAALPFPAFPFFPVALAEAATAVAVSLAGKEVSSCKKSIKLELTSSLVFLR